MQSIWKRWDIEGCLCFMVGWCPIGYLYRVFSGPICRPVSMDIPPLSVYIYPCLWERCLVVIIFRRWQIFLPCIPISPSDMSYAMTPLCCAIGISTFIQIRYAEFFWECKRFSSSHYKNMVVKTACNNMSMALYDLWVLMPRSICHK